MILRPQRPKSSTNALIFHELAGEWLSRDPLAEGTDATLYSYVWNDPIYLSDSFGLGSNGASTVQILAQQQAAARAAARFTHHHEVPPNSSSFTAPDGTQFYAPPGTDFNNVYNLGKTNGTFGINAAVGHYGTCDYQRNMGNGRTPNGTDFYHAYTDASNYAVGVYMNGAGYSLKDTLSIAAAFAAAKSLNAGAAAQTQMQTNGWNAAQSGNPNGTAPATPNPAPSGSL